MGGGARLADYYNQAPHVLGQILDWPKQRYPDRIALVCANQTYTFAELDAAISHRQAHIEPWARPGSYWGLALPNGPALLINLFALWRLGAIGAPLRPSWPAARIASVAAHVPFAGIIWPDKIVPEPENNEARAQSVPSRGGVIDLDPALVVFTSGSTGVPRGVVLAHHAVLANLRSNIAALGLDDDDKTLIVLPLAHAYALIHQCLCHLAIGATVFFAPAPLLGTVLCHTIEAHGITTVSLVPPMLKLLLDGLGRTRRTCASLRLVTVGAARADSSALASLQHFLPHTRFALTYGLTEAGPRVATRFLDEGTENTNCVGEPLPNVAVAEIAGSLWVRTRAQFSGYVPLASNAWHNALPTGDRGYLTDKGIVLTGRADRSINRGGVLIAPETIEAVLLRHPAVHDVQVRGEPHPDWGQVAVAHVAVREPVAQSESETVTEAQLIDWCKTYLAPDECPARMVLCRPGTLLTKGAELMQLFGPPPKDEPNP